MFSLAHSIGLSISQYRIYKAYEYVLAHENSLSVPAKILSRNVPPVQF